MADTPLISICIPAYRRTLLLKRLLDSIQTQSFRDFEVIITDDSPSQEVGDLVAGHPLQSQIRYVKNALTLGSPENWNEAVRQSAGEWIKIMHDDDWFSGPESLAGFAKALMSQRSRFYFSAYTNRLDDGAAQTIHIPPLRLRAIQRNPELLMAGNHIGPPSVVIFKKDESLVFDNRMQWLVDIDFYIRYLKKFPVARYLSQPLVQIGISQSQVTQSSFGHPAVEIPEHFMLLEKTGTQSLSNLKVYDSWWRFIRNLSIKDIKSLEKIGYLGRIPDEIVRMVNFQKFLHPKLLKIGIFSKILMGLHYLGGFQLSKGKHL
jgi:glycosyltransferase involved in cell wall biosynthesis